MRLGKKTMKKIIIVCHGNICRSPMAEYIFKHLLEINNLSDTCEVVSRATSREEIGNDIYPPAKKVLSKNNIPFHRHYAKQITKEEYNNADYIFLQPDGTFRRQNYTENGSVSSIRTFIC